MADLDSWEFQITEYTAQSLKPNMDFGWLKKWNKELRIKPPYDPAIPLLGICPEETKIEKDTCIPLFTAALFIVARTWKKTWYPLTDEWIKKLWYINNGTVLSYKKEWLWINSNEVDEPRTYYTEWSKSERERWISYTNAYIQNLEKWYWRIYLQGSNGETDIDNTLMDVGRGEKRVRYMERVTWKLTLPYVK